MGSDLFFFFFYGTNSDRGRILTESLSVQGLVWGKAGRRHAIKVNRIRPLLVQSQHPVLLNRIKAWRGAFSFFKKGSLVWRVWVSSWSWSVCFLSTSLPETSSKLFQTLKIKCRTWPAAQLTGVGEGVCDGVEWFRSGRKKKSDVGCQNFFFFFSGGTECGEKGTGARKQLSERERGARQTHVGTWHMLANGPVLRLSHNVSGTGATEDSVFIAVMRRGGKGPKQIVCHPETVVVSLHWHYSVSAAGNALVVLFIAEQTFRDKIGIARLQGFVYYLFAYLLGSSSESFKIPV